MPAALPPAAKLSLMDRKNVRDEWEAKKAKIEADISEVLGVPWTIEVDPLTIAPYTTDRPGQLGDIIFAYFDALKDQLAHFIRYQGDISKDSLNEIASAHVVSLGVDEEEQYSYCGPVIKDGRLVIVFKHDAVWVNVNDSLEGDKLLKALDAADKAGGGASGLSPTAKASIASAFDPEISAVEKEVREILKNDSITFNPNWESVAASLAAAPDATEDWESRIGVLGLAYYQGLPSNLKYLKFDSDDMLQEAFTEAVSKNEIALRIVDELKKGHSSYCEAEVEDGVLYINVPANRFGTNCDDAIAKLVEVIDEAL